ncbi:MAG: ATP-binding protein [Paludibacteraceae bacterium]|nr:ATP-binding protein [Paludibacteraceae bacterium]
MNPFNYVSIAQGDNFYDRKEETKHIVSTLSGGNNVVMFAPRRYGKTSLVFKVMQELEKQGIDCVYIDLMTIYSLESFAEIYLNALYKKQTATDKFIQILSSLKNIRPKITFDETGKPQFGIDFVEPKVSASTLFDIFDLPERMAQQKRLVVVMDEFQEIGKFHAYGIEAMLRSKIQQQHHANYLFLGSKTHIIQEMFMAKNRPFYNSAITIQISTLPTQETCDFLTEKYKQSGITISHEMCMRIIEKVDNVPYYIQLLAAEIWQHLMPDRHEVTSDVIDECFMRVVNLKSDYYFERFDRLSHLQKRLLKAIVENGVNIYSAQYINKYRLVSASSIQKAAATLLDEGLIDKTENTYSVTDPFFKTYLQQH